MRNVDNVISIRCNVNEPQTIYYWSERSAANFTRNGCNDKFSSRILFVKNNKYSESHFNAANWSVDCELIEHCIFIQFIKQTYSYLRWISNNIAQIEVQCCSRPCCQPLSRSHFCIRRCQILAIERIIWEQFVVSHVIFRLCVDHHSVNLCGDSVAIIEFNQFPEFNRCDCN